MSLLDKLEAELEASEFKYLKDLTVLTADNDPYRQDCERKRGPAEWFAQQVKRLLPTGQIQTASVMRNCRGAYAVGAVFAGDVVVSKGAS